MLSGRPGEVASAEQVQVEMEDGLSTAWPHVVDCTVAVLNIAFAREFGGDHVRVADDFQIVRGKRFTPEQCAFLGMMSTCVGALGLMSSNTKTSSSSYIFRVGILPAMILQKRQFGIRLHIRWPGTLGGMKLPEARKNGHG